MILILGKTGYVSNRFQKFFEYKQIPFTVVSLKENHSLNGIEKVIKTIDPKFVINCIGYTGIPNIEACENQKEECLFVNVTLSAIVAQACKNLSKPLGLVSTGCIYDGNTSSQIYSESDSPNFCFNYKNCSWYSGTKELGERLVSKTWENSYIWRIRLPFNHIPSDKNLISKLLKFPKVVSVDNSFTNIDEFVRIAYLSMENQIPYGIYNMTNPGCINAREILEIGKTLGITKPVYEYFESEEEFKKIVSVPRSNCVLNSNKINQYFKVSSIKNSFEDCFRNWGKCDSSPFWF
jgi:dTDP-4-dehydrorhamnose reductase